MRYVILIYFFLLSYLSLSSQSTFIKSIDIDNQIDGGNAIKVLEDGYLILSNSFCFDNTVECYSVIKLDLDGNIIWKNQLKDLSGTIKTPDSYGNHGLLYLSNDSSIYTSGIIKSPQSLLDCFILKLDTNGDSVWLKRYGSQYNDFSSTLIPRSDSTLLLFSDLASDPNNDVIWLMEIDLNGNKIWEKTYGELNKNVARQDILQLEDESIVFSHFSCERDDICYFGDSITLNLTKIDRNGNESWKKSIYRFTEYWSSSSLISLNNGRFVASFHRTNLESGWWYPPILIFIDSLGNVESEFHFPEQPESLINDLFLNSKGEIIGVGYVDKFDLGFAGWVFSMSQQGELNWNREIADLRFPDKVLSFNAVEESENEGLIITGFIYDTLVNAIPTSTNRNIVLAKLDSYGCIEVNCNDLQIVAIEKEQYNKNTFDLFPNPANNTLIIKNTQLKYFNLDISIISSTGQILFQMNNYENDVNLDISDLPNGIYFVQILIEQKYILMRKFVKQ